MARMLVTLGKCGQLSIGNLTRAHRWAHKGTAYDSCSTKALGDVAVWLHSPRGMAYSLCNASNAL
jgi:hypothetical protein